MTTTAQIKKMLKPVLQRHPDLAFDRRHLIVKPIHHVLSGVLFDQTSGPGQFRPLWFATHFFNPDAQLHMGWSVEFDYPRPNGWSTLRLDIEQLLKIYLEDEALLHVRALRRLPALMKFVANHMHTDRMFADPMSYMTIQAACGNLQSARWEMKGARKELAARGPHHDADYFAKVARLCDLLEADDLPGMAAHLHAWEAENVRKNKLEHLWEPSPFPLEDLI